MKRTGLKLVVLITSLSLLFGFFKLYDIGFDAADSRLSYSQYMSLSVNYFYLIFGCSLLLIILSIYLVIKKALTER